MCKRTIICFLVASMLALTARAQQPKFITEGKIEYERKLNLYAELNDDDPWDVELKKRMPQFKVSYFDLYFNETQTLFKPGRENVANNKLWEQPSEDNIVYTDLTKHAAVSQKHVFEKTFLVQDSARRIRWKITEEKRTIAGFECRRANAVIMDSIYIVAFYTDEISTTGGPESFCGLPGMILGLAIPHEHITWFATRLYTTPVKPTDMIIPQKGTKITNAALKDNLRSNLKSWGRWGERYIKAALL